MTGEVSLQNRPCQPCGKEGEPGWDSAGEMTQLLDTDHMVLTTLTEETAAAD